MRIYCKRGWTLLLLLSKFLFNNVTINKPIKINIPRKGNKTKIHEIVSYPFLHKSCKTNVHNTI